MKKVVLDPVWGSRIYVKNFCYRSFGGDIYSNTTPPFLVPYGSSAVETTPCGVTFNFTKEFIMTTATATAPSLIEIIESMTSAANIVAVRDTKRGKAVDLTCDLSKFANKDIMVTHADGSVVCYEVTVQLAGTEYPKVLANGGTEMRKRVSTRSTILPKRTESYGRQLLSRAGL